MSTIAALPFEMCCLLTVINEVEGKTTCWLVVELQWEQIAAGMCERRGSGKMLFLGAARLKIGWLHEISWGSRLLPVWKL